MFWSKLRTPGAITLVLSILAPGLGLTASQVFRAERRVDGQQAARQDTQQAKPRNETPARTARQGDPLPSGAIARLGTARLRHGREVTSVAFSPDGKLLGSGGVDCWVRLWDTATGREVHSWEITTEKWLGACPAGKVLVHAVAFFPNAKALACGNQDGSIRLLDVDTGKELGRWNGDGPEAPVLALAISPDGKTLAAGGRAGQIGLWDVATAKRRLAMRCPGVQKVRGLAFSPDGATLASEGAGTIHVWNASTGHIVRQLPGARREVCRLAFSPDGKKLDATTEEQLRRFGNAARGVRSFDFSPDGRTAAIGSDTGTISLWDTATGKERLPHTGHTSRVGSIAFSPDGKLLATGSDDQTARLWEATTGKELRRFGEHQNRVGAVAFAPDGKLLAAGIPVDTIHLWDLATGKEVPRFPRNLSGAFRLAFTPDGKQLVSVTFGGTGDPMRLWDVATGKEIRRFPPQNQVWAFALSPDGKLIATGNYAAGKVVRLWDVATAREVAQLPVDNDDWVHALAFSPDSETLAVGPSQGLAISFWDVVTRKKRGRIKTAERCIWSLAFSPDGRTLAMGGHHSGIVYLWEVATGTERRRFVGHTTFVEALAFSPSGKLLASAGWDGVPLVWDVTGQFGAARRPPAPLAAQELESHWKALSAQEGARAYQAVCALAVAPGQSVPVLKERLRPVQPAGAAELAALIADLGADKFAVRQKATTELAALGKAAEGALRQALANRPPLETRRRVQQLLDKLEPGQTSPEYLLALRAVEVLEMIGSAEARQILGRLAQGAPGADLTREAQAALQRLDRRPAGGL
jgi:WD40 repeat protein